jgi:aminoglycoside 3-N-acetyltransferase I
VRQLAPPDVALCRALHTAFGEAFEDHQTYSGKPPTDAYLQRLLAKDHIVVLVAISADTILGGLFAYELEKFEQQRSEFYIYDLAVREGHRRQGIATALIAQLRQIAANRGVQVIFVQADYGDDPAIALYDKLGTREEVLHFDIAV